MKWHLDRIATTLGLVAAVAAMSGMVATGAYDHAAAAEARGYQALFHAVSQQAAPTTVPSTEVGA